MSASTVVTPTLLPINITPKRDTNFTFIDLFAGIGGTRIAFEKAGGECVFSSEWDKNCQKTYAANFGEIPHGDITKIPVGEIPDSDILVAGFPCQPFSTIGKRQGFKHPTQGTLFYDIYRILKGKRKSKGPKAFLLENVPGLKTHDGGKTFNTILKSLKELDYDVYHEILDGADFGVPQRRKRIYIVGFRKDIFEKEIKFNFPKGSSKKRFINEFLEDNADGYSITRYLQKTYLFKRDDGKPHLVNKKSKEHVKTLVSTYHKIQRLTSTFVEDGNTGIRLFTENECKAVMGFNSEVIGREFVFPVSRTQMYRQMGNSVVIPAVTAVAKKIAKKLANHAGKDHQLKARAFVSSYNGIVANG